MANAITPAEMWVALLDEIYQEAATSNILDTGSQLLQWMADSQEFRLGQLSMDGLGDYSRSDGYPKGDVTLEWETHKPDWERGRMFTVDAMDDEEAAGLVFSNLAGEFIRTKVVPELDAVRYATYTALVPTANAKSGALADAAALIAALRVANNTLDEAEVPEDSRYLFIRPSLLSLISDMDTTKSREVLDCFATIQKVPQGRFYSAIDLLDGVKTAELAGGFKKATGAVSLNFLVIHKPAVLQALKHVAPKIVRPEVNQTADAWKYGYRAYGITSAQALKLTGLYVHKAAS
ncbi:MAG: hypothetical protein FWE94_07515 [Coriobacteriia bacterium]|nr:hypothetical protein [Coriobacteriia bacterium]